MGAFSFPETELSLAQCTYQSQKLSMALQKFSPNSHQEISSHYTFLLVVTFMIATEVFLSEMGGPLVAPCLNRYTRTRYTCSVSQILHN
jgi:hypothetical protein